MIEVTVETNAATVAVQYGDASKLTASVIVKALRDIGLYLQRHLVTKELNTGGMLEPRTRNLARSVFYRLELAGRDALVRVGFDLKKAKYARLLLLGGTVVPKTAQFLTIPLTAAKTASGVTRFRARDVIAAPERFGYTGTFFAKRVLFGRRGQEIVPLFALKSSVRIPAHPVLTSALDDSLGFIAARMGVAAQEIARSV